MATASTPEVTGPAAAGNDLAHPPGGAITAKPLRSAASPRRFVHSAIPAAIFSDPAVAAAAAILPPAYDFEIPKTVHRLRTSAARVAALQLPDGLLMYSLALADIFLAAVPSLTSVAVLADPTYGACCLADRAAAAVAADILIHYGHSCLVPVTSSAVPVLYVFVDIRIDAARLVDAVRSAFPDTASAPRLALAGTVQFLSAVHAARSLLEAEGFTNLVIPQAKPLSPGEVLGCTAPTLPRSSSADPGAVIFVADGRFHLEAFMIANPRIRAYRYDPFLGVLVLEEYDHAGMKEARKAAILAARKATNWGVVLGTLGRQGSTRVLDRVVDQLEEKGLDYTIVLVSELSPARMELFGESIDAWVQIACPRLSIDWGEGFRKPTLATFEFDVAMGYARGWWEKASGSGGSTCGSCSCQMNNCSGREVEDEYPMDYYAQDGGDWSSCYMKKKRASNRGKPNCSS